jgi:hypothetical protein
MRITKFLTHGMTSRWCTARTGFLHVANNSRYVETTVIVETTVTQERGGETTQQ